jgi:hypothetical protein
MTAKEALRELVDELPEDEAALWLERMRVEKPQLAAVSVWDIFARAAGRIPAEESERIPSSDAIDEVVYRFHGR